REHDRFFMLETIREFAAEQLEQSADADEVRRRHAEHFRALAEAAGPELEGDRQDEWFELVEDDLPNLRLALAWCVEREPGGALELFDEAEQAALVTGNDQILGMARFNAGYLELTRGDYAQAEERLQAAHAALAGAGHHHGAARSLAALGSVALHEHRTTEAV